MVDKLRAARRNPQLYEQYFIAKRLYKTEIRKSKKAKQDQEIEQLRKVNDINEAWKYLKRNRGDVISRKPDDNDMFMYFFQLLDGEVDQPEIALSKPTTVDEEHLIGTDELQQMAHGWKNLWRTTICYPTRKTDSASSEVQLITSTS